MIMQRIEFKADWTVDEAGAIEGLASVFGTADRSGDIVRKGAFAKVRAPLPMLASHDQADVIGVWDSITETAQGLLVKGRMLVADVVRAAEVRALILAGAMSGLSIGYVATKTAPRKGGGRDLIALDLMEVSVVAVPMHPDAKILSAKANAAGKDTMDKDDDTLDGGAGGVDLLEVKKLQTKLAKVEGAVALMAPMVARMDKLEAKMQRGDGSETKAGDVSSERKAWGGYLRVGDRGLSDVERKAFNLSADTQGGYLAPPEIAAEIIRDLIEFSPIRALAAVSSTNAPSLIYNTRGLMGNATWHGEQVTVPESVGNPFGQREIVIRRMSTFFEVSNQNLQYAPAAIAEVNQAIVEDFGKKESTSFVNGVGNLDPTGLMTNAEIPYSPSGSASVILADGLIAFLYKMAASYRNKGTFIMNGSTLAAVRSLKDTTNNYLWQPSFQAGQPETLLGRPVVECIDMPDIAANAFPILYGDFSGYQIVDGMAMTVLVDPYSQAQFQKTRYHAARAVGADVVQPYKFRKFKISIT